MLWLKIKLGYYVLSVSLLLSVLLVKYCPCLSCLWGSAGKNPFCRSSFVCILCRKFQQVYCFALFFPHGKINIILIPGNVNFHYKLNKMNEHLSNWKQKNNPKYLRKRNLSIRGGQIKTPAKLIFLVANKTFALKGSVILSNVGDEIFKRWTIFWQTYFRGFCQIWGFRAAILYPSQFFFLSQLSIVSCCICLFSMK